jgi:hypothetical protein
MFLWLADALCVIPNCADPPKGHAFCIAMLIAAMVPLSRGVAGILGRAISGARRASSVDRATAPETAPILGELQSAGAAGDLVGFTPASGVTEVTTRNLEVIADHSRDK